MSNGDGPTPPLPNPLLLPDWLIITLAILALLAIGFGTMSASPAVAPKHTPSPSISSTHKPKTKHTPARNCGPHHDEFCLNH